MNIKNYNLYIEKIKNLLFEDITYLSYNVTNSIGNKKGQIGALAKLKDSYNYIENIEDKIEIAYIKTLKR
jgi:L-rhamnose mutarotase